MAFEIRPTHPDELPALSRFLTEGFHAPPDASFAAPDVLRWKYFDPRGDGDAPRSYVAVEEGQIIGHIGVTTGAFLGAAIPSGEVSTLHMTDWLSSRPGAAIGSGLMLRSHRGFRTQYGLEQLGTVPVFRRILRPARQLRAGRVARWARDLVRLLANRPRPVRARVEFRPVDAFGPEIVPILDRYKERAVFTDRRPALLNHLLRYPRGGISGWRLERDGELVGFALLGVVPGHDACVGKIVDCVLADPSPALWHAAIDGLTRALTRRGADVAEAFGSTDWMALALRSAGYAESYRLDFNLRDKRHTIPAGAVYHFTPIEADYAYT
jgi:hypothetical protein